MISPKCFPTLSFKQDLIFLLLSTYLSLSICLQACFIFLFKLSLTKRTGLPLKIFVHQMRILRGNPFLFVSESLERNFFWCTISKTQAISSQTLIIFVLVVTTHISESIQKWKTVFFKIFFCWITKYFKYLNQDFYSLCNALVLASAQFNETCKM